jgi:thiamine-monophosphate kinase
MNEYDLLKKLSRLFNFTPDTTYPIGTGDDAAVRRKGDDTLIISGDSMVEDIHFSLSSLTLEEVGYKAVVSNLSDCAAMASLPESLLVQVVFPAAIDDVEKASIHLYRGIHRACKRWNIPIIGGNLSAGPCWMVAITVLGTVPRGRRLLRRDTVVSGDSIWISGHPGESAAGLAAIQRWGRANVPDRFSRLVRCHCVPVPRVELACALARYRSVHAMMDISDGIGKDIATMCRENRCGARIRRDLIPRSKYLVELCSRLRIPCHRFIIEGGEAYELLFAASSSFDPRRLRRFSRVRLTRIGTFIENSDAVELVDTDGESTVMKSAGWDHIERVCNE